jgi:site-specific DNA recombinase
MTNAIGYIRRSTDRQDESLDQQRDKLTEYANSNGWTLSAIYCDDAISGSDMDRPGLQELLSAAKSHDVDVVMAWDRNRIARPKDALDGLLLERKLQESGKRVVYASTGQESDRSFASGLISYVEHYQNGDYLRKLSRDTMRGTVDRAKRGLWTGGPPPFGFDRLILDGNQPKRIVRAKGDGGQLVLEAETGVLLDELPKGKPHKKQDHEVSTLIPSEPARVRALKNMFEDYASGAPTRKLRDDLNSAGFRTSRGSKFTVQTLLPMLENPAYVGKCVYNRRTLSKWHRYQNGSSVERQDEGIEHRTESDWIVHEDAWAALVEQTTFDQVQQIRKNSKANHAHHRGNAMKSNYLLTGRIFCGVCNGRLTGTTRTSGKGYKTRYYVCSKHQAGHTEICPKRYSVPADLVEQHILKLIQADLLRLRDDTRLHELVSQELGRLSGSKHDASEQLQKRLAGLDQKIALLKDHLGSMTPQIAESLGLYQQAEDLVSERSEIERELEAITSNINLPSIGDLHKRISDEFEDIEKLLASGTLEERRSMIGNYVDRIKADPNEQVVHIGLYPTLLSQRIAGAGFEPTTSGL